MLSISFGIKMLLNYPKALLANKVLTQANKLAEKCQHSERFFFENHYVSNYALNKIGPGNNFVTSDCLTAYE